MSPALIWIMGDINSWKGDTSGYATQVVYLYSDFKCCIDYWLKCMLEGYRAPLILWVGQFFVPVGIMINDIGAGLLLLPFLATVCTLTFTFKLLAKAFKNKLITICGTFATVASPFLFGYTLGFWIEPLQVTIIVFLLYSLISTDDRSIYYSLSLLVIIICLALLIKVSTGAYLLLPTIIYLVRLFQKKNDRYFDKKDAPITIFAIVISLTTCIFYVLNYKSIINFASFSYASDLYSIEASKMSYGISKICYGIFTLPSFILFFGLMVYAVFRGIFARHFSNYLLWICTGQIIIFLFLWANSPNSDPRFILPNLPYFIILFCWILAKINSKKLVALTLTVFIAQYLVIAAYSMGIIKIHPAHPMIKPMTTTPTKENEEIEVISKLFEGNNKILLDLEPDIYLTDLELELLKKDWKTNWRERCSDVNRLLDISLHQIDTSQIDLNKIWDNLQKGQPDYIITRPCRVYPDTECSELSRVDKYDAQTAPTRKALVTKIYHSGQYNIINPNDSLDLIIFKRIDNRYPISE